jgi:hypothetical protein
VYVFSERLPFGGATKDTTMNTDDRNRFYAARLSGAFRSPETESDLGKAVARLREPFQVGDGGNWLYEGFVSAFTALFDALRAIDDSIPPGLPRHLLDPVWIAEEMARVDLH